MRAGSSRYPAADVTGSFIYGRRMYGLFNWTSCRNVSSFVNELCAQVFSPLFLEAPAKIVERAEADLSELSAENITSLFYGCKNRVGGGTYCRTRVVQTMQPSSFVRVLGQKTIHIVCATAAV